MPFRPAGRRLAFAFVFATLAGLAAASRVHADAPSDEAERARLQAEYERDHDPSVGCSLGEIERRLGHLDVAAARLTEVLQREGVRRAAASADDAIDEDAASETTLAACHYNLGRVREQERQYAVAFRQFESALRTPVEARRATVEQALVRVASVIAAQGRCTELASPILARALLRLGDDPAIRACIRTLEAAHPTCEPLRGAELADTFAALYSPRRLDGGYVVAGVDGMIFVARARGPRATSGFLCDVGLGGESMVRGAAVLPLRGGPLLVVRTQGFQSYSCDCAEESEGSVDGDIDCRCSDEFDAVHLLRASGTHLLSLGETNELDGEGMASPNWAGPLCSEPPIDVTLDPRRSDVVRLGTRRLVLRNGALVPAPAIP